jgi:hypothetical protein
LEATTFSAPIPHVEEFDVNYTTGNWTTTKKKASKKKASKKKPSKEKR